MTQILLPFIINPNATQSDNDKRQKNVKELYFAPRSERVAFLEKSMILYGSTEGGEEGESYSMRPFGEEFDLENILF